MNMCFEKRVLSLALAVLLSGALIQPAIAAYTGVELPDCHSGHDDACGYASPGVCAHICDLCNFSDATVSTSAVTSLAGDLGETGISLPVSDEQRYGLEIGIESAVLEFSGDEVTGIIIDASAGMDDADWAALRDLDIPDQRLSLTINGLEEVIPDALYDIFGEGCLWLETLSLPHTKSIGAQAFAYCINLSSVSIPVIEEIGDGAFDGCESLTTYFFGDNPLELNKIGDNAIFRSTETTHVYYTGGDWSELITEYPEPGVVFHPPEPGIPAPGNPDPGVPDPGIPNPGIPDPGVPDPGNPDPGNPDSGSDPNPEQERTSPKASKPSSRSNRVTESSTPKNLPLTTAELSETVEQTIQTALNNPTSRVGGAAVMRLVNRRYISLAQLKEIAVRAKESGVPVMIHADTMVDNVVISRLCIDPSKATRGVRLLMGTGADTILRRFEKYTKNTLAVLSLDQQGGYGMKLGIAVKLKLSSDVKAGKLTVYSYNPGTNKYKRVNVRCTDIGKGYIWLETDCSGFIVIGNGNLQKQKAVTL